MNKDTYYIRYFLMTIYGAIFCYLFGIGSFDNKAFSSMGYIFLTIAMLLCLAIVDPLLRLSVKELNPRLRKFCFGINLLLAIALFAKLIN